MSIEEPAPNTNDQPAPKEPKPKPWTLLGGMMSNALNTLMWVSRSEASAFWPCLVFFAAQAVMLMSEVYWSVIMAQHSPFTALQKLWRSLVKHASTDLFTALGALVVLFFLTRFVLKIKRPLNLFSVVAHILVPLAFLQLVGAALSFFGNELWFMPHRAVDSRAVFTAEGLSWFRVIAKNIITYGPGALLIASLLFVWRKAGESARPAPLKHSTFGLIALLIVFAAALWGGIQHAQKNKQWLRPAVPGDTLMQVGTPWLAARDHDPRGAFLIEEYRGKVVLLDFWASWCPPCLKAIPEYSALQERYDTKEFVVVGVNREPRNPQAAIEMMNKLNPSFSSTIDKRYWGDRLGIRSLPTSMLIDKKGVLRFLHLGYTSIDKVEGEVKLLIAE